MERFKALAAEWWKQVLAVVVAAVLLFNLSANTAETQRQLEALALENHTALCTFKADIERRFDAGQKFLEQHPQGIEGITREDIKRSLEAQRSTLRALRVLDCTNGEAMQ